MQRVVGLKELFIVLGLVSLTLLCVRPFQAGLAYAAEGKQLTDDKETLEDQSSKQARALLKAIDSILEEASDERRGAKKLPSRDDYIVAVPPWTETREDRQSSIQKLLESALSVVTDAPIVEWQTQIGNYKSNIETIEKNIANLREKRLDAPKDSMLPGILTDTVASIDSEIADLETRILENESAIDQKRDDIKQALTAKGVDMSSEQLDLLLGSVLSDDLIKLVAAFDAARAIDTRLGQLMSENGESVEAARRYFAMHAALFAMLMHAQDTLIQKIDQVYLRRLESIITDIRKTRFETRKLLRGPNREDQRRALLANRKAQDFSEKVAVYYRDYLKAQREQILAARNRTKRDLRIADNTYETVEASFQLKSLVEDAKSSFDAIRRLEAPGFDQIFQNEELRKEFENLTRKLAPTS